MSPEEAAAVVVTVLSVWLATRRSLWNFPTGLLSVAMYAHIFFLAKLYADMALQIVFALTLLYGWWQWWRGRRGGEVLVVRLGRAEALGGLLVGALVALAVGAGLHRWTDASVPWVDAPLMAASLVGSLWSARRQLENWPLWVIVDVAYVALYVYKSLWATALLYALFVALAVAGWRAWLGAWRAQVAAR